MKRWTSAGLSILLLALVEPAAAGTEPGSDRLSREEIAATVTSGMERNVDPCVDFYRYACGGWLDSTELPADESHWARSFSVIEERNRELVREILERAAADPGDDPDRQKIGRYYGTCMEEQAVEEAGVGPLRPTFDLVAGVEGGRSLLAVTGKLHRWGLGALFGIGVVPDFKDPDLNIAFFLQGGLGMPDRDYYVSEDETKRELLAAYEEHVARMFGLAGEEAETAKRHAAQVVAFESELARVSRPRAEMRQVDRLYNRLDLGGLKELTPTLPWEAYLAATGHPEAVEINVATPEFFTRLEELVAETELAVLQAYLRWHVIDGFAELLSSEFVTADFEFFGARLLGQEELEPRWKRCVEATEGALGEVVGKVFVERRFAGTSKEVALEMIGDIEGAFESSLDDLAWMDDTTRLRALEKKAAVRNKIGYPDLWRDYSAMALTSDDFFANALAGLEFEFDREAKKIGEPVDPDEWLMTPQMVNAYYHPLLNEIAFPAGILQPPFFHRDFPAAMNYGGIGGVIGHELTHGFDDQGRKFNPSGQLVEWWEPQVAERFQAQAQCVEELYSSYEVEPGVKVNGQLTLGENIADIGGLKQAYQAYKMWEGRHGAPRPLVDGLTDDQLFFISWGQVWCTVASAEYERLQVTTDPHSPPRFRVIGPVSNHPGFARTFGCAEGTPMNPADQCVVW